MATIQISKTKSAGTVTKTAITQKQSLDVVQTMLHGSLSCISYLRELFAEKAYDDQYYEVANSLGSYDDYVNGNASTSIGRRASRTRMKVLRRGRSRRVDMFLDWLEEGAFPALQQGNLQSLQIYVHPDASSRDEVLETYTFNVEYTSQSKTTRTLCGRQSPDSEKTLVDVHATSNALNGLLLETMELCKHLPELPEKRYISMALLYTREITTADGPQGFIANDSSSEIIFPHADGWEVDAQSFSHVNSGFHSSSVNISFFKPFGYSFGDFADSHRPKYPALLAFSRKRTACGRAKQKTLIEIEDTPDMSDSPHHDLNRDSVRQGTADERHSGTRSSEAETVVEHSSPGEAPFDSLNGEAPTDGQIVVNSTGDGNALSQSSRRLLSQFSELPDTQSSNVLRMRSAFANMMHAEQLTQGDTQTQVVSPSSGSRRHEERPDNDLASPVRAARPALSQHICRMLDSRKHELRRQAKVVGQQTPGRSDDTAQVVTCQCGYDRDEGGMFECVYCETWQHLHCYGYLDAQDKRLPDEHVCYHCLLGGSATQPTFDRLKTLALRRRAIYVARHQGLRTLKDIADTMHIQPKEAKVLKDYLKSHGYAVTASGSKTRDRAASRQTTLVAVSSGPHYNRMLNELFDPLMHISHLYELPVDQASTPTDRPELLPSAKEPNMPPPATPASQLRRKKAVQTPASGLDLRNSATPFKTPTRVLTQRGPSTKRRLEDVDDDNETVVGTPQPKRTRTTPQRNVKSVRSEMMLNADGLSSSPAFPDMR